MITEGSAKLHILPQERISRKLPVFYNPVMKLNRDISILLLNSVSKKNMQIGLPLSGSGVRGIRFLKELKKSKIQNITFNDNKTAVEIKKNLKMNNLKSTVYDKDANLFLLESKGFDYIDIDPFGSPNPFLESATIRLARNGILAVTATDTSALAGSHPKACLRKYWAKPLKNEFMHESGIRILIRKVQLIGAQFEKALTPIFSYFKDHYYRIFFRCEKGKQKVDNLLEEHKYLLYNSKTAERLISKSNYKKGYDYAGPLWAGKLWDVKLVNKMYKNCDINNKKMYDLVSIIKEESQINVVSFYDLHKLAKIKKKPAEKLENVLMKGGSRTHFLGWGVRSKDIPI